MPDILPNLLGFEIEIHSFDDSYSTVFFVISIRHGGDKSLFLVLMRSKQLHSRFLMWEGIPTEWQKKKNPSKSFYTHGGFEEIILRKSTTQYHTVRWEYDAKKYCVDWTYMDIMEFWGYVNIFPIDRLMGLSRKQEYTLHSGVWEYDQDIALDQPWYNGVEMH